MESNILLAVNGTLMRGLELNGNLISVGATFIQETTTAPMYRLWSISNRYPAMQRVLTGGKSIALEVWSVPAPGILEILLKEPPGLCIGNVKLVDGQDVLGVLGEAIICLEGSEITQYGGWRAYVSSQEFVSKNTILHST